jgi:hypothetical protein
MSDRDKPPAETDDSKRSSWTDWIINDLSTIEVLVWLVSLPFRVIAWTVGAVVELLASIG